MRKERSRISVPPMEQRGTRKTDAAGAEITVGFCEGEKMDGTAEMISEIANLAFDSLPERKRNHDEKRETKKENGSLVNQRQRTFSRLAEKGR